MRCSVTCRACPRNNHVQMLRHKQVYSSQNVDLNPAPDMRISAAWCILMRSPTIQYVLFRSVLFPYVPLQHVLFQQNMFSDHRIKHLSNMVHQNVLSYTAICSLPIEYVLLGTCQNEHAPRHGESLVPSTFSCLGRVYSKRTHSIVREHSL